MFCAVCFGDPASPLTHGYNAAVFMLLALTVCLLAAFGTLFLHIRKRTNVRELLKERVEETLSVEEWDDIHAARKELKSGKTVSWRSVKRA